MKEKTSEIFFGYLQHWIKKIIGRNCLSLCGRKSEHRPPNLNEIYNIEWKKHHPEKCACELEDIGTAKKDYLRNLKYCRAFHVCIEIS